MLIQPLASYEMCSAVKDGWGTPWVQIPHASAWAHLVIIGDPRETLRMQKVETTSRVKYAV